MAGFFDTPIEYLKGIGPQRAMILNKELNIFTFGDLIQHYPFRYEDRTKFYRITELNEELQYVQVKGVVKRKEVVGTGFKKRLVAHFADDTGELELVWFQGINWVNEKIKPGVNTWYSVNQIVLETNIVLLIQRLKRLTDNMEKGSFLQPVYPLTEKLRTRHLDSKALSKIVQKLLLQSEDKIRETLPHKILTEGRLLPKKESVVNIHFPGSYELLAKAQHRLKFEELFYIQLRLLKMKLIRQEKAKGQIFQNVALLTSFYNEHLPFALTDAQKKVIKEIYSDLKSGKQMNRLLQGDVGSGKTIVGYICMLIVISGSAQCALMAPTEILAQQHFNNLRRYADKMQITIALLTGSTKKSERKEIHERLRSGTLKILIGTHACWRKR